MRSLSDLHDYQRALVQWLEDRHYCAAWVPMGLGKTISTLTALVNLEADYGFDRALVIAPLRVANTVWKQEAEQWAHTKHLRIVVATGDRKNRLAALAQNATITVINRENVKWLVDTIGAKAWPFDLVVIDESDSFKDRGSARFRALKAVRPRIRRLIELTGTPTSNGLLDIWSQIFLLDGGQRLGRSLTSYKEAFFESDYMGYNFTLRKGADVEIHKRLQDLVVSLSSDVISNIPERVDNFVRVSLPEDARKAYCELEREFLLRLEEGEVVAMNEAVLTGKLQQAANGALYMQGGAAYGEIHDAKLGALEDIVEAALGRPVLVAYNFRSDVERLKQRFPYACVLDKGSEMVEQWNAGRIKMLLVHPASAGHGLNLQAGGSTLVWFGLNWSLALYQQMNARLHRQGQKDIVIVHHLVATQTIDEVILQALRSKGQTQTNLLEAVRADIVRRGA